MAAEARREDILVASLELFARQGRHGVTTRAIAEAAGVSEALLYRHFPSKEHLFSEVQKHCLEGTQQTARLLASAPPSTELLVLEIYFMCREILGFSLESTEPERATKAHIQRLCLASLAEDGEFVRGFLAANMTVWVPVIAASLAAAERAGDLSTRPPKPELVIWFSHHAVTMLAKTHLPAVPVVDYGVPEPELLAECVRFALRGVGLSAAAIDRTFNPAALEREIAALTARASQGDTSDRPRSTP